MAKEKNLTTVTSIAAADFARLVTSAGASVKATAANLAKYIIETYNGSTVAGSAQTVKSALDSLNSKTTGTTTNINPESVLTIVGGGLGSYAEKYGQVVHFISMVKLTDPNSALENGTVVFRLPSGLRPSRISLIEARQFSRMGGTVGYGYIKTDGEVYLSQGGIEANAGNIIFEAFYLSAQ